MNDCTGKTLLAEKLGELSLEKKRLNDAAHEIGDVVINDLTNTFCCVEVPVIERTYSWLKFSYLSKVVYKKVVISWFESNNETINIVIKTPIPEPTYCDKNDTKGFVLQAYARHNKEGKLVAHLRSVATEIKYCDEITSEEFKQFLVSYLAEYILKFNRENPKESV